MKNNTITVGNETELKLYSSTCALTEWVGEEREEGKKYGAKIRYRQEDQEVSFLISNSENTQSAMVDVVFSNPQRAITSGQICVIYDKDIVIGSGIIA